MLVFLANIAHRPTRRASTGQRAPKYPPTRSTYVRYTPLYDILAAARLGRRTRRAKRVVQKYVFLPLKTLNKAMGLNAIYERA